MVFTIVLKMIFPKWYWQVQPPVYQPQVKVTKDIKIGQGQDFRREASFHAKLRAEYFEKSQDAYRRGSGEEAYEYAQLVAVYIMPS